MTSRVRRSKRLQIAAHGVNRRKMHGKNNKPGGGGGGLLLMLAHHEHVRQEYLEGEGDRPFDVRPERNVVFRHSAASVPKVRNRDAAYKRSGQVGGEIESGATNQTTHRLISRGGWKGRGWDAIEYNNRPSPLRISKIKIPNPRSQRIHFSTDPFPDGSILRRIHSPTDPFSVEGFFAASREGYKLRMPNIWTREAAWQVLSSWD